MHTGLGPYSAASIISILSYVCWYAKDERLLVIAMFKFGDPITYVRNSPSAACTEQLRQFITNRTREAPSLSMVLYTYNCIEAGEALRMYSWSG
jgi:hypothetical protein